MARSNTEPALVVGHSIASKSIEVSQCLPGSAGGRGWDDVAAMWAAYFEMWAHIWRDVAETLEARERPVQWIVDFGSVRKNLADVHPQTGVPALVAPTKEWIEQRLEDQGHEGLTVLFRIEPTRGLTYALHGPRNVVAKVRERLDR